MAVSWGAGDVAWALWFKSSKTEAARQERRVWYFMGAPVRGCCASEGANLTI